MNQTQTYEINGTEYWIDMFDDGYRWCSDADQGESFPTALEALQDAMRYVTEKDQRESDDEALDEEESLYGSERDQVRNHFNSTRL